MKAKAMDNASVMEAEPLDGKFSRDWVEAEDDGCRCDRPPKLSHSGFFDLALTIRHG